MITGPGRPPIPEAQRTRTQQVRLGADLAEKLAEIVEVEEITSAEFLDPLVRQEIENRHAVNLPAITALRNARECARRLRDELPKLSNDLGENGAG